MRVLEPSPMLRLDAQSWRRRSGVEGGANMEEEGWKLPLVSDICIEQRV